MKKAYKISLRESIEFFKKFDESKEENISEELKEEKLF